MSPEEIRAVTPAGARGPADLVVVTAAGEASRDAAFAYFDAYLRGDVLGDGRRDISDAISVLNYLFRGGTPPPCLDAADSSRDGSLNITDPVYLLAFLFSGGPAPAPDGARCHGDG
jgi:hypothetical protein